MPEFSTRAPETTAPSLADVVKIYPAEGFSPPGSAESVFVPKATANPPERVPLSLLAQAVAPSGPTIVSALEALTGNAQLDYNALKNAPSIPAAQVQVDWELTSGIGSIKNKPTIPDAPTITSIAELAAAERVKITALADDDVFLFWDQSAGVGASANLSVLKAYAQEGLSSGDEGSETGASIVAKLTALTGNAKLPYSALRNTPSFRVAIDNTLDGTGTDDDPLGVVNPISAAQLTKLNGIEERATADQTAADIVALLEEQQGSARLDYTALDNRPTIPSAETGATIVGKLSALTGNARLSYSALRDTPTGVGGSPPTLHDASISFTQYTIGNTVTANDIYTYTVPASVAPSSTSDTLCIMHLDFTIGVSGAFSGANRVEADFTLVRRRGSQETMLARETQYIRRRNANLFNRGSFGIDADANLRTGDQLILRDRTQGEATQTITQDTDSPNRISIVAF